MPSLSDPYASLDAAARVAELAEVVAHAFAAATATDPSLSRGLAGASWLLAESGDPRHRETARELLARAVALHAARPQALSLFAGSTGLQWTRDALSTVLFDEAPEAEVELDRRLAGALRAERWRGHHDLVDGLVGIGVYALANPRPGPRDGLCAAVLGQLERTAIRPQPDHAAWITDRSLLAPQVREQFPDGNIDLGLAHGVPGVAAWLADVAIDPALPVAVQERAGRLLDAAISWMLVRREAEEHPHGYPYFVEPDGRAVATPRVRLAWCYGDLGVAWAVLKAASARGRRDWAEVGQRIGARAVARDPSDSGVVDPWLCHGGAGIAHMFASLARATGEPSFAAAARRWWQRALQLAEPITLGAAPALLEGATGLGLALAATRGGRPRWNAMLLL